MHASVIEGGQEYSSYPARCLRQGERRTIPGETVEDVRVELEAIAQEPARPCGLMFHRHPFEAAPEAPVVRALHRHLGHDGRRRGRVLGRLRAPRRRGHTHRRLRADRRGDPRHRRMGRPRLARALPRGVSRRGEGDLRMRLRVVHVGRRAVGPELGRADRRAPRLPPRRGRRCGRTGTRLGGAAARGTGVSRSRRALRTTGADVVVLASPPSTHRPWPNWRSARAVT